MPFRIFLAFLCGFIAFITVPIPAGAAPSSAWTLQLDSKKGAVEFDAVGRPSALKIHGKGEAPQGALTIESKNENEIAISGTVVFTLNTLDTGISMRNEHMKNRYLETAKFPEAKLAFDKMTWTADSKKDPLSLKDQKFSGTLSLHGVDRPVSGTAQIERKGDQMSVQANFNLKISDFNIAKPGFAGITMAEDVSVSVQIEGTLKKSN